MDRDDYRSNYKRKIFGVIIQDQKSINNIHYNMELIVIIAIGLSIYAAIAAPIKRSKHRANCPKCGTECKASPWGTSRYFEARYKCPKCGHKFYSTYSKL